METNIASKPIRKRFLDIVFLELLMCALPQLFFYN